MSTTLRSAQDLTRSLLFDRRYFWYLAALTICGDAILTQLIVKFVPCKSAHSTEETHGMKLCFPPSVTEIDYETYMLQVARYEAGERSYPLLTGPTGPLV